jgi:hypothetical protein
MNRHHLRFVLPQYIEHKTPSNLRLHLWTNIIGWLALTTALSQIPLPFAVPVLGANVGAACTVHKRYVDRPALASGDGPVGLYRKWVKQFYD